MAANSRTVGPKTGGGWQVTGGSSSGQFPTQAAAEKTARAELTTSGGGELILKGRDGQVREKRTIAKRDPRATKG
ncbi:MAG TPA: DUF2188 domain-containing protein [Vitreimonas sp.]|nr:DUF2188 domain-containing protein [Vitreimonas sp.]